MPLHCGVEIIGLIGSLFRAEDHAANHVPQNDFQGLPVLFVHGKQKHGHHGKDQKKRGGAVAQRLSRQEIRRHTHRRCHAKADELAFRQVEQHLGFDFGNILGDGYIGNTITSLMSIEHAAGQAAGFEKAEAQKHRIAHTGPDGTGNIRGGADVLHQHGVDGHADHD